MMDSPNKSSLIQVYICNALQNYSAETFMEDLFIELIIKHLCMAYELNFTFSYFFFSKIGFHW